jgi:hypothetical protein
VLSREMDNGSEKLQHEHLSTYNMAQLSPTPYKQIEGQRYLQEIKIVIKKQDFNNVQFQDGTTIFSFSDCDFKKITIQNDEDIDFQDISIGFSGCYIEDIQVTGTISKNLSVSFYSCIVSGKINDSSLYSITFNNCILRSNFFIINQPSVYISFGEENIFPRRWLALCKRLSIGNINELLRCKQSYYIYDCARIRVSSNFREDSKGGYYSRPFEKNKEFRLAYKLTADQKKLLDINLTLKYEKEIAYEETKIEGLVLNSLALSGSRSGKISIENTKIANWYLTDFLPKNEVTFYNISPPEHNQSSSMIQFHKSNLDNTSFDNINFDRYGLVSFYRTKFSETVFTSCRFPKNAINFEKFKALENVHYPDKKGDNFYKDQYAVYLQLKTALEAAGNFYEAQKLFAISNDALRKIDDVTGSDKFILWVNSNSNNHGLSIKRPVLWFFAFTIPLYILYLWSLDRVFNNSEIDYDLIGYYFSFIDLTHRHDFLVDKSEFNAPMLIIDYITKLLVGFFIYQLVAAFRKYGKK